jgi:phosphoribosylglycinamide formyltransferase-1
VKTLVILISGRGLNAETLIEHCAAGRIPARVAAVISNRADAEGLERAGRHGVPTEVVPHREFATRAEFDAALRRAIDRHAPDVVVLAGFMRILGDDFVRAFHGRLVNIHPSLLPKYAGVDTHARALAAGESRHGATVHFVTNELDGGPAIIQGELMVDAQDTPQALADRVMKEIELKIYPQAVAWLARGDAELRGDAAFFRGAPLRSPRTLDDVEEAFG